MSVRSLISAFVRLTSDSTEPSVALRALVLHMMEGHARGIFDELSLSALLAESIQALSDLPAEFPSTLPPDDAMARIDAWYVLSKRNLSCRTPEVHSLTNYLQETWNQGYRLHAWLMAEMAEALELRVRQIQQQRPFEDDPNSDAYWLTHLYLLATDYLHRPLPDTGFLPHNKELLTLTPWVMENRDLDLGAEIAICLQVSSQHHTSEHEELIRWLAENIQSDGSMPDDDAAHCTATALLALAGATYL